VQAGLTALLVTSRRQAGVRDSHSFLLFSQPRHLRKKCGFNFSPYKGENTKGVRLAKRKCKNMKQKLYRFLSMIISLISVICLPADLSADLPADLSADLPVDLSADLPAEVERRRERSVGGSGTKAGAKRRRKFTNSYP
jgi:hypothetical protein